MEKTQIQAEVIEKNKKIKVKFFEIWKQAATHSSLCVVFMDMFTSLQINLYVTEAMPTYAKKNKKLSN